MTDDEKKFRKLVAKAVESLVGQHQRIGQELDMLRSALDAEPTPGQQTKDVLAAFAEHWKAEYGDTYRFTPRDAGNAKRLIVTERMTVDDLIGRVKRYLLDKERFLVTNKHPFGIFVSKVNSYAVTTIAEAALSAPPVGCKHTPPCRTDVEHTKRYMQELRK